MPLPARGPNCPSSTFASCCIAASARCNARRSCVKLPSWLRGKRSGRSSKRSATSLPSPSSPPPTPSGPASRWAWVVGLVVTLGLLAWALHGVDAHELVGHLRRANLWLMLATIALATLTFPLRALRWRLILRDVGGSRFPLLPLWHATAIGFMANNLLPVRAGEFARAYAAKQALPVRFTTALASVGDRKSTRLNSSHGYTSYAVFCLKKKRAIRPATNPRCE